MNNDSLDRLIEDTIEAVPQMTYEDGLSSQLSAINDKNESYSIMLAEGLENIDVFWGYLAFGDDSIENKLKACESYIDLLHSLKHTPEQGLFICQECSSVYSGKRSGLCPGCKKKRKKQLRKKRESTEVYKAHRAADSRYQNRINKTNIKKERKDYLSFWDHEYDTFCEQWLIIKNTLSEAEQIEWLNKQCRR